MIRRVALVALAGVLLVAVTGCGLSDRQAQNAADAIAGIDAAAAAVGVEFHEIEAPATRTILAGARDHVLAMAEGSALPAPTMSPEAIIAQPASYRAAAAEAKRTADATVPWWGWVGGAAAALVGLCRFLPGPGGLVADAAWKLLAPGRHQDADVERATHADGFRELVTIIEGLHNDDAIRTLKQRVTTKASGAVRDAIQTVVAGQGAG